MKSLKESFIKAKDLDNLGWPNPFNIKESDITGKIEGVPIEIITLALIEYVLISKQVKKPMEVLHDIGIVGLFSWENSKDRHEFWSDIANRKKYELFYKKYTPKKLKDRFLEMVKLNPDYKSKLNFN